MSNEHPLLLNTLMVRATLDKRKTLTRRVILPQPELFDLAGHPVYAVLKDPKRHWKQGDLIWAKETWSAGIEWDEEKPSEIDLLGTGSIGDIWYWADGEPTEGWGKKRPSIFMPKLFTRLWLEIVSIRAERLQEISEIDCWDEGIDPDCATATFSNLRESINAKRIGCSWASRPYVWRIEFKMLGAKP